MRRALNLEIWKSQCRSNFENWCLPIFKNSGKSGSVFKIIKKTTPIPGRCPVLILHICFISTADICPVSTADISISIDHSGSAIRINNQQIMKAATAADLTQASRIPGRYITLGSRVMYRKGYVLDLTVGPANRSEGFGGYWRMAGLPTSLANPPLFMSARLHSLMMVCHQAFCHNFCASIVSPLDRVGLGVGNQDTSWG